MKIGIPNWPSDSRLVTMEARDSTTRETIMTSALAHSLGKNPLRLALGVAINLGGMLAIAASL